MIVRHFLAALAGELACLIIGGTLVGFVGWTLNSHGVAADPENFWAICVLAGAALGLISGGAVLAWWGRGVPGKVQSVVAAAGCWVAVSSVLLAWVIWSRT